MGYAIIILIGNSPGRNIHLIQVFFFFFNESKESILTESLLKT